MLSECQSRRRRAKTVQRYQKMNDCNPSRCGMLNWIHDQRDLLAWQVKKVKMRNMKDKSSLEWRGDEKRRAEKRA